MTDWKRRANAGSDMMYYLGISINALLTHTNIAAQFHMPFGIRQWLWHQHNATGHVPMQATKMMSARFMSSKTPANQRQTFKRFPASIAPSDLPRPKRLWISSMKRIILPSASVTSFKTPFKRSSNSPLHHKSKPISVLSPHRFQPFTTYRYLAPATRPYSEGLLMITCIT